MRVDERWEAWRRFAAFDRPHRRSIGEVVGVGRTAALPQEARGRTRDGAVSESRDGEAIAVRAHQHLPQGMRDSRLRNALPQCPKHMGTATAGEPGPRRPAMGVAGTHSGTGPDERRAQGLGSVGKSGSVRRLSCRNAPARRSRGGNAGTGKAWEAGDGGRRDGFPDAGGHAPPAIIGSGHCLQSRISHDSFLVGYDWGELGCGCNGYAIGSGSVRNFTGDCIARVL